MRVMTFQEFLKALYSGRDYAMCYKEVRKANEKVFDYWQKGDKQCES